MGHRIAHRGIMLFTKSDDINVTVLFTKSDDNVTVHILARLHCVTGEVTIPNNKKKKRKILPLVTGIL